jgi:hypothetical protein
MALLAAIKRFFGRDAEHPDPEVVPPAPLDPVGTTPDPDPGAAPPVTPPAAPRDPEEEPAG